MHQIHKDTHRRARSHMSAELGVCVVFSLFARNSQPSAEFEVVHGHVFAPFPPTETNHFGLFVLT